MSLEHSPLETTPATSGLEGIDFTHDFENRERSMEVRESDLTKTLDAIRAQTPEQRARLEGLRTRVNALSEIQEDLKEAASVAQLATAIEGLAAGEATESDIVQKLISEKPDIAARILQQIIAKAEHIRPGSKLPTEGEDETSKLLIEARSVLEEIDLAESKIFKGLAARTAERIIRAIISASTLGIGGVAYDIAADTYKSIRTRKELRSKKQALLSSARFGT